MRPSLAVFVVLLALSACSGGAVAEFWRPISEPNTRMPLDKAQLKLEFDLSQCNCGIFPTNVPQPDLINFQPDQQRYIETGLFRTGKDSVSCKQSPSLVVGECMRARGWETTKCSGRMPLASGGALCSATVID